MLTEAEQMRHERDRARDVAARLEAELSRVIAVTEWRDCTEKQGICDTRCRHCGCCEHAWVETCQCSDTGCGCGYYAFDEDAS